MGPLHTKAFASDAAAALLSSSQQVLNLVAGPGDKHRLSHYFLSRFFCSYIVYQHLVQCSESLVSLVSSNPLHRLKYIHVRDIGLKLAQEMDANRSRIFFSRLVCYRLKFKLQNALASSGAVFSACSPFSISLTSDKRTASHHLENGLDMAGEWEQYCVSKSDTQKLRFEWVM